MALTKRDVERFTKAGKKADGKNGLYLRDRNPNNRNWLFRYKQDRKARWMVLGPVALYNLDHAREEAIKLRLQVRQGLCPIAERNKLLQANKLARARRSAQTTMKVAATFPTGF